MGHEHEGHNHYHPHIEIKTNKPGLRTAAIIASTALRLMICPGDDIALVGSQILGAVDHASGHHTEEHAVLPNPMTMEGTVFEREFPRRKKKIKVNPQQKLPV